MKNVRREISDMRRFILDSLSIGEGRGEAFCGEEKNCRKALKRPPCQGGVSRASIECKRRGFFYLMFLILTVPLLSFAQTPNELFIQANLLYKEKNYAGAIALYDSIAQSGSVSPELFFNLGNAHFKNGNLAPAILNYERAKKLAPDNADIDFNLRIANLRVVDRVEAVPELFFVRWVKNLVISHSSDGWAKLALVTVWVTFVLALLFLFVNHLWVKRISVLAALLALVFSLLFAFLAYNQYNYQRESSEGIVFVKNVYVKSAPDTQSTDLFMLREGIKVTLLESEGEWQKIQLADGKVGWMMRSGLETI